MATKLTEAQEDRRILRLLTDGTLGELEAEAAKLESEIAAMDRQDRDVLSIIRMHAGEGSTACHQIKAALERAYGHPVTWETVWESTSDLLDADLIRSTRRGLNGPDYFVPVEQKRRNRRAA